MKRMFPTLLIAGIACSAFLSSRPLLAQQCKDEEAIVLDTKKSVSDLVQTVKRESLQEFDGKFHQKSYVSSLTFAVGLAGELVDCLDKASQDAAATEEQKAAYKAKQDAYTKLRDKLDESRNAVKSASASKDAKALIEKLDLPN